MVLDKEFQIAPIDKRIYGSFIEHLEDKHGRKNERRSAAAQRHDVYTAFIGRGRKTDGIHMAL